MSIEQNIANRQRAEASGQQVEQLFNAMLDVVRDDFKRLTVDQRKRFLELAHDRFAERLDLPCCQKNKPLSDCHPPKAAATEADEAIASLMEIIELCDAVPLGGEDFAESVAFSARSMISTIERTGRVSVDQESAIRNWHRGVMAWVER